MFLWDFEVWFNKSPLQDHVKCNIMGNSLYLSSSTVQVENIYLIRNNLSAPGGRTPVFR